MLQRPGAGVLERYLSSLSPPDHLLYQMLKMVPVWGGGSDLMVPGSTCGRAGRLFLRIIFLVFLDSSGFSIEVTLLVVVRSVPVGGVEGGWMNAASESPAGEAGEDMIRVVQLCSREVETLMKIPIAFLICATGDKACFT